MFYTNKTFTLFTCRVGFFSKFKRSKRFRGKKNKIKPKCNVRMLKKKGNVWLIQSPCYASFVYKMLTKLTLEISVNNIYKGLTICFAKLLWSFLKRFQSRSTVFPASASEVNSNFKANWCDILYLSFVLWTFFFFEIWLK